MTLLMDFTGNQYRGERAVRLETEWGYCPYLHPLVFPALALQNCETCEITNRVIEQVQ